MRANAFSPSFLNFELLETTSKESFEPFSSSDNFEIYQSFFPTFTPTDEKNFDTSLIITPLQHFGLLDINEQTRSPVSPFSIPYSVTSPVFKSQNEIHFESACHVFENCKTSTLSEQNWLIEAENPLESNIPSLEEIHRHLDLIESETELEKKINNLTLKIIKDTPTVSKVKKVKKKIASPVQALSPARIQKKGKLKALSPLHIQIVHESESSHSTLEQLADSVETPQSTQQTKPFKVFKFKANLGFTDWTEEETECLREWLESQKKLENLSRNTPTAELAQKVQKYFKLRSEEKGSKIFARSTKQLAARIRKMLPNFNWKQR